LRGRGSSTTLGRVDVLLPLYGEDDDRTDFS
jgi:hypothetical protein